MGPPASWPIGPSAQANIVGNIGANCVNEKLYKKGYDRAFLECLNDYEVEFVLKEIHEGI